MLRQVKTFVLCLNDVDSNHLENLPCAVFFLNGKPGRLSDLLLPGILIHYLILIPQPSRILFHLEHLCDDVVCHK
jgi:hypothetical protein